MIQWDCVHIVCCMKNAVLAVIMERASDTINFNPLVIWCSTVGWLIGDVSKDGESSNPLTMVTHD